MPSEDHGNRVTRLEFLKQWRRNNRARWLAFQKKYYHRHAEVRRAKARERYALKKNLRLQEQTQLPEPLANVKFEQAAEMKQ